MPVERQFETNPTNSNENVRNLNSFGICFFIKNAKEINGMVPIYARITVNKLRTELSLKRSIESKNWNSQKGMPKGNKEEIKSLISFLEQVRHQL